MFSSLPLALTILVVVQNVYAAPRPAGASVSTSSRCGLSFGLTCKGSSFGDCCSSYGYCGSTKDYCSKGCQAGYGTCYSTPTPPASSPAASPVVSPISHDGSCGGPKGYTCLNSQFGNCCSKYGWCGSTSAYCQTGCNPAFGTCSGTTKPISRSSSSTSSSTALLSTRTSSATPASTLKVSANARCGYQYKASPGGMTCLGSQWGDCCSDQSYWCVAFLFLCSSS
ncbi:hypothetical protein HBI56_233710 [Parastagonospora nodorum]|nr:hypothetical protein HBH52_181930 [Parastagonospora nodorum]KAH3991348.1 hypothetical protein HBI10_234280 [Parastagonospora nodorum]KAH4008954.1 hypothetical protein HBI13_228600 [Parastagonospora nodorum]KAH4012728.1 hypothetical protein HBI09_219920 [Parastagonospora nodorum]KAH4042766.1 hypothetical protein HBH49_244880 [Parastagonospora nodorum]